MIRRPKRCVGRKCYPSLRNLIGREACASTHYWAREIKELGHDVRLMPAKDVKAYVKRNKNDSVDAAACCEAVRRPTVRTVPAAIVVVPADDGPVAVGGERHATLV